MFGDVEFVVSGVFWGIKAVVSVQYVQTKHFFIGRIGGTPEFWLDDWFLGSLQVIQKGVLL
jgi:hypothetical protein